MTDKHNAPRLAALRDLEASWHEHRRNGQVTPRPAAALARLRNLLSRPRVRKVAIGSAAAGAVVLLSLLGLWWRLATGPIELDMATPWLAAAIEQNLGSRHSVEVGGTQIEQDESGHTSLRIRDIVIRDADGAVVASAPKAEVAVSTGSLLLGQLRATRVSLVGAALAVRIEESGQITVSTGDERRPLAVTKAVPAENSADIVEKVGGLFAWLDGLASSGFDADGLGEIGLKNGRITVDDRRTGKQWAFDKIDFSVNRVRQGGLVFSLGSENPQHPWLVRAAVVPSGYQRRTIQFEARKVSTKDLLLALRLDGGQVQADLPVSAAIRAEIGPDATLQQLEGRIVADAGLVGDPNDEEGSFWLDQVDMTIGWDAQRRALIVPIFVSSGGNRIRLVSQVDVPRESNAPWRAVVTGGSIVLAGQSAEEAPLVFERILMLARLDPAKRRIDLDQGDFIAGDVRAALTGNFDLSAAQPRLALGFAGNKMSITAGKRIWPAFIKPKVRSWVMQRVYAGTLEKLLIATNAPLETLTEEGPPVPSDGLSIEMIVSNAAVRPLDSFPAIRDADMTVQISGRTATVNLGRGTVELESGRRLTLTNGVFEVPDTFPKAPPANVRFRVDGPVQAGAELLAIDRLRDVAGTPIDPATSRGNISAQVRLGMPIARELPPGATKYNVSLDISNFAAEKMIAGQRLEAQSLRVTADNQGYQIKGDVKINGAPAVLDYRKPNGDAEADIRLSATIDDSARAKLGLDAAGALTGPVPLKLTGRVANEKDGRFSVEADLTNARIDNLFPGWNKAVAKPARAVFTVVQKAQGTRFEDVLIDGAGVLIRGNLEIDQNGEVVAVNFPVFALSDGDKTSLKADRGADGALRVTMRGEVYDGRNFIKHMMAGQPIDPKGKRAQIDLDLDVRLGAVAGFNGEALRGLELKMSRRAGHIRAMTLNSRIGRDAPLIGDLRGRTDIRNLGRNVLYFETADAGALFRFTDTYARMHGGQMWIAMDPPTPEQIPQEGLLNIRDFQVRGETALDRVAANAQNGQRGGAVDFSRMRVEFTRAPGRLSIQEGLVRGPVIGATIDGHIDYNKNDVRMRGTFVPLYGLNNVFGQLPIVGLFLGGSNEGLVGITYEVVGTPSSPQLRVNPISAVAPGLLRKFFEFRNNDREVTGESSALR